jgi:Rad3-related DNA helicase
MPTFNAFKTFFNRYDLTPRISQAAVLKQIADNWETSNVFIIDAPTGVGKQFIGQAVAEAVSSAYIVTSSKQLQEQYLSIGNIVDLRGRSNYACDMHPLLTAESAPCSAIPSIRTKCIAAECCEYITQRDLALNSPMMLTNYAYFLYSRLCGPLSDDKNLHAREILILDEAHSLESALSSFAETCLDPTELHAKFGLSGEDWNFSVDLSSNVEIALKICSAINSRLDELTTERRAFFHSLGIYDEDSAITQLSPKNFKRLQVISSKLSELDKYSKRLLLYVQSHESAEWIIEPDLTANTLTLTPLTVDFLYKKFIKPSAVRILFMSATIGLDSEFRRTFDLDPTTTTTIAVDSVFQASSSPILYTPVGKMSYSQIEMTIPKLRDAVDQILTYHSTEKGIIHSTNYRLASEIYKGLSAENSHRLLCREMIGRRGKNVYRSNTELVERHCQSPEPTVLLSPSMSEGISLDDELSRFQIILKLPFANLRDPRVNALLKSGNWYINQMFRQVMQSSGRSTRSADDFSVTYILDEAFNSYFQRFYSQLPRWFRERVVLTPDCSIFTTEVLQPISA